MNENDKYVTPDHYKQGGYETADFIEDTKLSFWSGNAVKYVSRAGKKVPDGWSKRKATEVDLAKATWYVKRMRNMIDPGKIDLYCPCLPYQDFVARYCERRQLNHHLSSCIANIVWAEYHKDHDPEVALDLLDEVLSLLRYYTLPEDDDNGV